MERNLEAENKMLKKQCEEEVKKQWKINKNSFPTSIEPLRQVVMTTLFSRKQEKFEKLAEALEAMTTNTELRPQGMSFVITKYQEIMHEQASKYCQCSKGLSIVQAIIHMEAWNTEGVTVNGIIITPEILFEYGLLRKIL